MTTIIPRIRAASALAAVVLWLGVATASPAAPTILVFGDSLSAAHGMPRADGWVAIVRRRLAAKHPRARLINASVSGETSAGGRARFGQALARVEPDIVVLELGGNDGLRVQKLAALRANLAAMIETARARGARVLLFGMRIPPNYGPVYSKRFHAVFDRLAQRYDVAYDAFFLAPIADDRANFQPDGIHPTAAAQPRLATRVLADLAPLLASDDQRAAERAPGG